MYRFYTGNFSIVTLNIVIVATFVTADLQTERHKRHVAMFIIIFQPKFHTVCSNGALYVHRNHTAS